MSFIDKYHTGKFRNLVVYKNRNKLIRQACDIQVQFNSFLQMAFVCKVFCQYCSAHLSDRGCQTVLRAARQIKIISTDYKTKKMIEIEDTWRIFDKCPCKIRDFKCASCQNTIGYHVVEPCEGCSNNNNGHYYIFHKATTQTTELSWDNICPIYKEQLKQESQDCPQEFICPICMEKMINPTIILCGHTFCGSCIQRHIDLKSNCPLDIKQMSREGPFIPNRIVQELIIKEQERKIQKKKKEI